jgi:hypothetical protein
MSWRKDQRVRDGLVNNDLGISQVSGMFRHDGPRDTSKRTSEEQNHDYGQGTVSWLHNISSSDSREMSQMAFFLKP